MRVARATQSGRQQNPLSPFGQNNIFIRKLASSAALATDQTPALKFANMCNYGNVNYSYNGSPAPSFYGYSGMGWGGSPVGNQVQVQWNSFTIAVYVVDASVPTQTVTYVQSDGTTPQPPGQASNLQSYFNTVPVPDVTKIPQGQIQPAGTDKHVVIWRPATNEMWEMWRFSGSPGTYSFQYGAYIASVNTFNGIHPNGWGSRATGLAALGGLITIQDLIDAFRGFPIKHAIGVVAAVTADATVPPATRHDSQSRTPQFQADGTTPNPAYGFVDGVAESTWFRLPSSFDPIASMPTAGPLARAIATAIRDYGMFVMDGYGNCTFNLEDARVLGSPYSWAKVNPFAGAISGGGYGTYVNNFVSSSWTDPTLPTLQEFMSGPTNLTLNIPWQQLQVLQPFSS